MKSYLLERLACPACGHDLQIDHQLVEYRCSNCDYCGQIYQGKPLFTEVAGDIQPFEKAPRGPHAGSPWRQANWRFLQHQVDQLPERAVLLDVGAGHGDFAQIFAGRQAILLDVFPYPEVDIVCDLTQTVPFRPDSFDAVVLMNVLEHVYDSRALFSSVKTLLKPGGIFVVAIPFLLKVHQAPYDFVRYTHFSLERLGRDFGLELLSLEGYYDPIFLLGEGWRNIERTALVGMSRHRRAASRALLWGVKASASVLARLVGKGYTQPSDLATTPAPIGYHVVYRN
jgi:SAM-dependent methyltransferase